MQQVQELVHEVVGMAEADPDSAAEIYAEAADRFRETAAGRHLNPLLAAALARCADQFSSRALMYARRATRDDFVEQEREQAQAHAEVGHFDDMEIRARRDQLHEQRNGRDHVSITPESVTQKTPIGREVTVKFNPTQAEIGSVIKGSNQVIEWQGAKNEAQTWTIDLNVKNLPAITSGFSCRPFADVQYGADGFISETVRVDVGHGTRIVGAGNYVSVIVGMRNPGVVGLSAWGPGSVYSVGDRVRNGGNPYVCVVAGTSVAAEDGPTGNEPLITDGTVVWAYASGTMTIGGGLGFFAGSTLGPVTYTEYVDDLDGLATTANILRPKRAVSILPPQSTNVADTMTLSFRDYANVQVYTLTFVAGTVVAPIPLTGDVAAVRLTNNGAGTSSYRLPFLIAL